MTVRQINSVSVYLSNNIKYKILDKFYLLNLYIKYNGFVEEKIIFFR